MMKEKVLSMQDKPLCSKTQSYLPPDALGPRDKVTVFVANILQAEKTGQESENKAMVCVPGLSAKLGREWE